MVVSMQLPPNLHHVVAPDLQHIFRHATSTYDTAKDKHLCKQQTPASDIKTARKYGMFNMGWMQTNHRQGRDQESQNMT